MSESFDTKILEVKNFTENTKEFVLEVANEFDFVPGQFVMVHKEIDGKLERRAYSIVSFENGKLTLCIKKTKVGFFAKEILKLKKGDLITISGPFGFFEIKNWDRNFAFLSTGTGIAPIKAIIDFLILKKYKRKIILFSGSKTNKDNFYSDYFENLEKENPNFEFHKIISKEKNENEGRVQDFIEEKIDNLKDYDYYICGVKEMVNDTKKKLLDLGVKKDKIFFEKY